MVEFFQHVFQKCCIGNTVTELPVVNGDSLIVGPFPWWSVCCENQRWADNRHWSFVLHLRVFSPPATFLNFFIASGDIRASSMEIKRTFTQSIHATAEDTLLLEIVPTKRVSITSGLVITRVLPALDAPITINVFDFSMTLSIMAAISRNSWPGGTSCTRHQFQKTLMLLSILSKSGSFADCLCRKTDYCHRRNSDLSCGSHPWIDCIHRKVRNGSSETCHRYLRNRQHRHSRSDPICKQTIRHSKVRIYVFVGSERLQTLLFRVCSIDPMNLSREPMNIRGGSIRCFNSTPRLRIHCCLL